MYKVGDKVRAIMLLAQGTCLVPGVVSVVDDDGSITVASAYGDRTYSRGALSDYVLANHN